MIYQVTLGGPNGPKITILAIGPMIALRLLGLEMCLREGLGALVGSTELFLDVIFPISSYLGPLFFKKLINFNDFKLAKPSISLERVVKIEDFFLLTLTSLFT